MLMRKNCKHSASTHGESRLGSLINCFHIIHLYSRKITLFLGQQSLGFNKNFPGCKESSHLRFSRLWGDLERILNPGADAWGERYGGDLKVASNYGARRILPPPFFKERFSSSAFLCNLIPVVWTIETEVPISNLESRALLWAIIW